MVWITLKWVLVFLIMVTILNVVTHMLDSNQSVNPALRGFIEGCEDKPQPCWHGIVPAQTTSDAATTILTSLGYTVTEAVMLSGGGVQMRALLPDHPDCLPSSGQAYKDTKILFAFSISFCDSVTLLDVINQLGIPDVADEPFTAGCNLRLVFADSFIQVSVRDNIDLSQPVQVVNLYSKGTSIVRPRVVPWIGPIPIATYKKQLHAKPCS
jgi:hypothetical protein